ncbi:MAG: branched-chain amino acid aminotransferase [Chitinophagaceae bacterium]
MAGTTAIRTERVERSKLDQLDVNNLPFGKYFTDHMLEVDFADGKWGEPVIRPYQPIAFEPSLAALHYGQAIFEGIKAYKLHNGEVVIFRPDMNFKRFNLSAARLAMPEIPEFIFMEGLRQLINLDKDWIPSRPEHSLYIRPFMFATDELLGVKPSDTYKYMVILSPAGPFFSAPLKIYIEDQYVRAVKGGVGYAKAAGNYGAAMLATAEAKKKGYDQVLWTDANEHNLVQEIGVMNVFFIVKDKVFTPDLAQGTILAGVTRDSAITVLNEMGLEVVERSLSLDEIREASARGELQEAFGTGTAATISYIKQLDGKDFSIHFEPEKWVHAPALKCRLDAIRDGSQADTHGWLFKI